MIIHAFLLAMGMFAAPARADLSDSGNLTIGGNGVISGSMTVVGPIATSSITLSTGGASVYAITSATGIHVLNGRIKLESGSYIQWPDDTTSTTSVSGGGENPYYSQAKTFGSTLTVTGNAFSVGGATFAVTGGKVGIGTTSPGQKLTVTGTIESTSGGIKFPDASVQTTAFTGAGTTFVSTNAIITADYTLGTTPFVCVPGSTATFTANGGRLMMHFVGINLNAATANDKPKMGFLVNGAQVAPWNAFTGSIQGMWGGYNGGGFNTSPNGSWTTLTNVSAGTTSVCVYAYRQSASGATLTCNIVLGGCVLGVTEIK